MMHPRKTAIICIIIAAVYLMFRRTFEGLKNDKCSKSISKYENGAYSTSSGGPPLSARECKGRTMRKGGDCYKSDGKTWVKTNATGKSCKSWVYYVDWNNDDVKKNSQNPFRRPQGYKKRDNIDFNGDKNIGMVNSSGAASCGKTCNETSSCAGFTLRKAKNGDNYTCFLVDQTRINEGEKTGSNEYVSYEKTNLAGKPQADKFKKDNLNKMCKKSGVKVTGFLDGGYTGTQYQYNECGKEYDVYSTDLTSIRIPQGYEVAMTADNGESHTFWNDQDFSKSNTWNDHIKTLKISECTSDACWRRA